MRVHTIVIITTTSTSPTNDTTHTPCTADTTSTTLAVAGGGTITIQRAAARTSSRVDKVLSPFLARIHDSSSCFQFFVLFSRLLTPYMGLDHGHRVPHSLDILSNHVPLHRSIDRD